MQSDAVLYGAVPSSADCQGGASFVVSRGDVHLWMHLLNPAETVHNAQFSMSIVYILQIPYIILYVNVCLQKSLCFPSSRIIMGYLLCFQMNAAT